ncbi:hypothetical protein JHW43_000541 [Diplocarpon mali]|nr:hypothetical protein JHW43_000541 [Diplocarpon mali]
MLCCHEPCTQGSGDELNPRRSFPRSSDDVWGRTSVDRQVETMWAEEEEEEGEEEEEEGEEEEEEEEEEKEEPETRLARVARGSSGGEVEEEVEVAMEVAMEVEMEVEMEVAVEVAKEIPRSMLQLRTTWKVQLQVQVQVQVPLETGRTCQLKWGRASPASQVDEVVRRGWAGGGSRFQVRVDAFSSIERKQTTCDEAKAGRGRTPTNVVSGRGTRDGGGDEDMDEGDMDVRYRAGQTTSGPKTFWP